MVILNVSGLNISMKDRLAKQIKKYDPKKKKMTQIYAAYNKLNSNIIIQAIESKCKEKDHANVKGNQE